MTITKLTLACALTAFSVSAQNGAMMSGMLGQNNFSVRYETRLEPPNPPFSGRFGGGVTASRLGMHRYIYDSREHKYLGYDLIVEPQPNDTYRVRFQPLSIGPNKLHLDDDATWTPIPLPSYPVERTLRAGDRIALDLLIKPDTNQRIVDYLEVRPPGSKFGPAEPAIAGAARDFSIHDIELRLDQPRVTINGQPVEKEGGNATITGAVGWIYVRDRGRFMLSLLSYDAMGFRKAGEVRGRTASFQWQGDTYVIRCGELIAPGSGAYNLYVLADPAYRPTGSNADTNFTFGAADRPEHLLNRR